MDCWSLFLVAPSIRFIRNLSIRSGSCPLSVLKLNLSYRSSLLSWPLPLFCFDSSCIGRKGNGSLNLRIHIMDKQQVIFRDLGMMDYQSAWDYQERLLQENVHKKS